MNAHDVIAIVFVIWFGVQLLAPTFTTGAKK